jgi:hypothetical protein
MSINAHGSVNVYGDVLKAMMVEIGALMRMHPHCV